MPEAPKTGPLTLAELLALWASTTDRSYNEPFLRAGEGRGLEAVTQGHAQLARASSAIDRTTQSLFILPWSGQSDEPASGERLSRVSLTVSRAASVAVPLFLSPGLVVFEEETTDHSFDGPVTVATGRRYLIDAPAYMAPGQASVTISALAQRPGRGYDNPLPGTIRRFFQPGGGFENDLASVVPGVQTHALVVAPAANVVVPEHVGSYVRFVAGANVGDTRRVVGYAPPDPLAAPPNGGTATLAATGVFALSLSAGAFVVGETVEQFPSGATGAVLFVTAERAAVDRLSGTFVIGQAVVGQANGATFVPSAVEQSPDMVAESGTAAWRVLSWEGDLSLSATNPESPAGGRLGMLDELGAERAVRRETGEGDGSYRRRVATPADTVSPAAILRTANRILADYGIEACLREVGTARFRGLFYDGDPFSVDPDIAFAYDLDFVLRPRDTFKLDLSYEESRAFFLLGVPALDLGEFGCAYDAGPSNAYDCAPWLAFYDGFPLTAAVLYRNVWQAVNRARAAGVGFDLYLEKFGCSF